MGMGVVVWNEAKTYTDSKISDARADLSRLSIVNLSRIQGIDRHYKLINKKQTTRIKTLEGQIEILDASINIAKKRRAKIRKVAKAIKETIPNKNTLKGCRKKPTPGTINTIATNVVDLSQRYGVSESLILGIIRRESAFCQEAISRAGAQGLMQLMPETAEQQAREILAESGYTPKPWRIKDNIWLGTYYISKRLVDFNGDEDLALKAYNAGIKHVKQVLSGEREDYYKEPKEYAHMVLLFRDKYQAMGLD